MPQMKPLNWISSLLFFSLLLLMFCILIFPNYSKSSPYNKMNKLNTNQTNWKW